MNSLKPIEIDKFIEIAKNENQSEFSNYLALFEKQINDANQFAVGPYCWFIGDNNNMGIVKASDTIVELTPFPKSKWEGASTYFLAENIHPDDRLYTLSAFSLAVAKVEELTEEHQANVRINIYTRMLNANNEYRMVLLQMPRIYSNNNTLVSCAIVFITDLSHLSFSQRPIMMTYTDISNKQNQYYHIPENEMKLVGIDLPNITKREQEILQLMAAGLNSPQIAEKLFLSYHTVEKHKRNIREKTNTKTSAELIDFVWRNNLI